MLSAPLRRVQLYKTLKDADQLALRTYSSFSQPSPTPSSDSRGSPPGIKRKKSGPPSPRDKKPQVFPSRHALLNRPDVTLGHERPSQRPFGVATKIQKLFKENKLEEAVKMVENSPLSSQSVVVWTLLVKQALEEQRFNRACEIWQAVSQLVSLRNSSLIHEMHR
jgi:hypothetical protein